MGAYPFDFTPYHDGEVIISEAMVNPEGGFFSYLKVNRHVRPWLRCVFEYREILGADGNPPFRMPWGVVVFVPYVSKAAAQ